MNVNSKMHSKFLRNRSRCSATVGLVLLLLAGAGQCGVAIIPAVDAKSPQEFVSDQGGRNSFLSKIRTRFDSPGIIGEVQSGWFCMRRGDLVWNQATSNALLPTRALGSRFRAELQQAGYPVTVISDAVFDEKKVVGEDKSVAAPLQVGIFVKEIAANLCNKGGSEWEGGAYLKLNWQVFAPEIQKVVFETTTEGSFKSSTAVKGGVSEMSIAAFAVAARNFLADPGFLKAVSTPANMDAVRSTDLANASAASKDKLQVEGVSGDGELLTQKITQIRSGVATVFGDVGSGTGFFVGSNGILLTNQHVVGKAKFVKVRLATGRELVGEVLRSDPARDVALIKTEQMGVPPLAVRSADAGIGEDVFALGSPLGDSFNTTLTKGILGGVREMGNQPFLQSDVAILPGNSGGPLLDKFGQVIGITVMGLGAKGLAGMNFFIPISDALTKLGVDVVPKKLSIK